MTRPRSAHAAASRSHADDAPTAATAGPVPDGEAAPVVRSPSSTGSMSSASAAVTPTALQAIARA